MIKSAIFAPSSPQWNRSCSLVSFSELSEGLESQERLCGLRNGTWWQKHFVLWVHLEARRGSRQMHIHSGLQKGILQGFSGAESGSMQAWETNPKPSGT